MLLGILLLIGILGRPKKRLVIRERNDQSGVIAARQRPLGEMARALAEPAPGATLAKRPTFSLSRRGTPGTLKVAATRTRPTDPRALTAAIEQAVEPITEPFGLTTRLRVRLAKSENRVQ